MRSPDHSADADRLIRGLLPACSFGDGPIVCAVSAPSSLAVDFARENGQTLVGFLRGTEMNIYCGTGVET